MTTTTVTPAAVRPGQQGSPTRAEVDHDATLFIVGAISALLTAVFIPIHVLVFIIWPPPLDGTAIDWFTLFQHNRLLGFLSMDLLLMADYVLLVPIVLALVVALRQVSGTVMMLGAALFLVAISAWFASNPAVEMLSLSNRYAAATTESERSALLAAGEAMTATYEGTAFHVSYILGSTAGILVGIGMLRGRIFSRTAAWAAILGNLVGFGLYLPEIGLALSVIAGPILWVWYVLIARTLLRLGRARSARIMPAT